MSYCDLSCKFCDFPKKLSDGSMTCRTFVGVFCKKKNRTIYKNMICSDYKRRLNGSTENRTK